LTNCTDCKKISYGKMISLIKAAKTITCRESEEIMILEGIKLSIVGVLFVYTFLLLMVGVMHLSSKLLRTYTEQEAREQAVYKRKSSANALMKDNRLIAIISAAVSAYRKRMHK
jgi:sodium pump decarboxylase gamma subunit